MKMLKVLSQYGFRMVLSTLISLALLGGFVSPAAAASPSAFGAVYTMTNAASGNEVLVYNRSSDGSLVYQGAYATGGLGSGAGLGSQSSLTLSLNNHWLFAVNAGSHEISSFAVKENGLSLVSVIDSGGILPTSLTVHKDWLYVLNAGGSGNINGFHVEQDGSLSPLDGSAQPLSNGGVGAAPAVGQIAFSSDGSTLMVTEKSTNLIDTYAVQNGWADAPTLNASAGTTPFGFAFDRHDHAIVSEAASGSVSSYQVEAGQLNVISAAVANGQAAACWIAISNNGKYAYTTNAASGTISSYAIAADGSLTLLNPTAGLTGSAPVDMAFSNNGQTLYALSNGAHTLNIFGMNSNGSLTSQGTVSVPVGVVGLAAR